MSKIDPDSLITEFVDNIDFDVLLAWADLLDVEHDFDCLPGDLWPDKEEELRDEVAGEMMLVGVK